MDELELRIAAHEAALIEVAAFIDPPALADAAKALRAAIDTTNDPEERQIKLGALGLIEDAQQRHAPPLMGWALPGMKPR